MRSLLFALIGFGLGYLAHYIQCQWVACIKECECDEERACTERDTTGKD